MDVMFFFSESSLYRGLLIKDIKYITKGLLSLGYDVASQVPWTLHTAALFGKQSGRAERPIGRGMHLRSQACCS